jgi:hypothetical protein
MASSGSWGGQPQPLLRINILELHTASPAQAIPCLFNALQEAGSCSKRYSNQSFSDSNPINTPAAVTCDDNLLRLGLTKVARQIILDLGERDLFHSGFPNCANHDSAADLATIARTSTVVRETS